MRPIVYKIAFVCWYLLSLIPLWMWYGLSSLLYYPLYYVVRYRRRIVRSNLCSCFPEKNLEEIVRIEKRFYAFFCDYAVETVKTFSISDKTIRKRIRFEGLEQLEEDFRNGRSCSLYLGHYCNWEWVSSLSLHLKGADKSGQIYHHLENEVFDRLFLYMRGRFGTDSIEMDDTFQTIRGWQKRGWKHIVGYISDQVPGYNNIHYWTDFLHHDTPVFTGAERIARILDTTAYYLDIDRPRRGYYVCRLVKMTDNLKEVPLFGLTESYFRMLEQTIRRKPEFWLWSHNRWKRTREEYNRLFTKEEQEKRLSRL